MNLPLGMTSEQQPLHMSWLHENDGRHLLLPEDPKFLPQRSANFLELSFVYTILLSLNSITLCLMFVDIEVMFGYLLQEFLKNFLEQPTQWLPFLHDICSLCTMVRVS